MRWSLESELSMGTDLQSDRSRLEAALARLSSVFRGMTTHPDESNCDCHWGSAEELALLKTPDALLEPDLLRRTWLAPDWDDHEAVLRRILPQFAASLVNGDVIDTLACEDAGRAICRGRWKEWPSEQESAVREFLHAWWFHTLATLDPVVPAHDVLVLLAEASSELCPWLVVWQAQTQLHAAASQHLSTAAERWRRYLQIGRLPWHSWRADDEQWLHELTTLLAEAGSAD
jgi:hypothetical protein